VKYLGCAYFRPGSQPASRPLTWQPVAQRLQLRGIAPIVPVLSSEGVEPPFWLHHAGVIATSLQAVPVDSPLVLVAHSGAGPLLPVARTRIRHPVAGYIFADAGVPGPDGATRFDLFGSREAVELWRARAEDGSLPIWTEIVGVADAHLQKLIPDPVLRRQFVNELRPVPLAVYEEPLPVFSGWPDAPCGYVRFSSAYEADEAKARQAGWLCVELPGGHLHMLAAPDDVANVLIDFSRMMGIGVPK
jgi:alpha/beta hydrolase family protein